MRTLGLAFACAAAVGCGGIDQDEIGHAAGDVLASFDESAEGGSFARLDPPPLRGRDLRGPDLLRKLGNLIESDAYAASCLGTRFSACAAGKRTKSFDKCTLLGYTLEGAVELTFSDPGCSVAMANDSVTRTADFTLTGPRGATLRVSAPNGGQKVTRTANGFTYAVGGIDRRAETAKDAVLFDISTRTSAEITVTGTGRQDRVMNGGTLEVTHKKRDYVVKLSPHDLTWTSGCNCPVSGHLEGTASGSVTGEWTVTMTGCGKATVATKGRSVSVDLDRCAPL